MLLKTPTVGRKGARGLCRGAAGVQSEGGLCTPSSQGTGGVRTQKGVARISDPLAPGGPHWRPKQEVSSQRADEAPLASETR